MVCTERQYNEYNGIKIFLQNLNAEQKLENDFFGGDKSMCSVKELHKQIFWKARSLWTFKEIIDRYHLVFEGNGLELGGGDGVHASYLKTLFPDIYLVYSDVSLNVVEKSERFERFFDTKIDEKWIIAAEQIPTTHNTFSYIFFFASFHHIQNYEQCIFECYRVLKPGGSLYLLFEPAVPKIFIPLYKRHSAREVIPERSFTRGEYVRFLQKFFPVIKRYNFTGYYNRESKKALLYYLFISCLPNCIVNILPSSHVIIARKL